MADIPGFKNIRLLAQKPVAIGHWYATAPTVYTMEVTFEDDTVINVKLDQATHDKLRARMAAQAGVGLEERMAARGAVVLDGEQKQPVRERVLPLDASGQQVHAALLSVSGQDAPPVTPRGRMLQEGESPACPTFGCMGGPNAAHNDDCPDGLDDDDAYDTDDHD